MKKPIPEDFGLTNQEYTSLVSERAQLREALDKLPYCGHWLNTLIETLITAPLFGFITYGAGMIVGFMLRDLTGPQISEFCAITGGSIGVSYILIVRLTEPYRAHKKRSLYRQQLSGPEYHKLAKYEEATQRYEYRQLSYWKSLRGMKFEKALAPFV